MNPREVTQEQIDAAEAIARVDESVVRAALARVPPSELTEEASARVIAEARRLNCSVEEVILSVLRKTTI